MNPSLIFNAALAAAIGVSAAAGLSAERAFRARPATDLSSYVFTQPKAPRLSDTAVRSAAPAQPRPAAALPIMPMSTDYLP
jgi:hypothetical protein